MVLGVPILKHFRVLMVTACANSGFPYIPGHGESNHLVTYTIHDSYYSRTSVARTLVTRLPRLFRTRS